MRAGTIASIVGHAAILGIGFFSFPNARPMEAEAIDALPVELVDISDTTDLLLGDKKSKELPADKPQPKPETQAEAPSPKPAEKPAEKPVEAAVAPAPPPALEPPPPEKAEPEPPPEPEQVAALPDPVEPPPAPEASPDTLPQPADEAEPKPAAPPRLPKARPKSRPIAKPVEPKPEERDKLRDLAKAPKTEKKFNTEDIAALLNKQEPSGGGDPTPATEPQTLGSTTGHVDAAMTQSWIAALSSKLRNCWNPPVGAREAGALVVTVSFNLLPDGSLAGTPVPVQVMGVSDPQAIAATDAALRAVAQCAPYNDIFPPEHYDRWKSIVIDFDPSKMLGAG
jgi:hypothetical protein